MQIAVLRGLDTTAIFLKHVWPYLRRHVGQYHPRAGGRGASPRQTDIMEGPL